MTITNFTKDDVVAGLLSELETITEDAEKTWNEADKNVKDFAGNGGLGDSDGGAYATAQNRAYSLHQRYNEKMADEALVQGYEFETCDEAVAGAYVELKPAKGKDVRRFLMFDGLDAPVFSVKNAAGEVVAKDVQVISSDAPLYKAIEKAECEGEKVEFNGGYTIEKIL